MKRKTFRFFSIIIGFIVIATLGIAGLTYYSLRSPAFDTNGKVDIFIDENTDYSLFINDLKTKGKLKNVALFEKLASAMKFSPENLKTGRYVVTPQTSYIDAVRKFRNGNQTPVRITFNNIRLKQDFARRIADQLMFSADSLLAKLNSENVCKRFALDTTTILTLFIPNTYEVFWNISTDNFLERMKREYDTFWNENRIEKAATIPLSPTEVAVLASIVEEETARKDDYAMVAGLYINRLRRGMPLQADPTVKFAVGDFALKRILYAHLAVESPYNTYIHRGLPPGPIRIPSPASIDSVLNYTEHNYIFMTAHEDLSGHTRFAATLQEHNRNAKRYHEALNSRGIK